MAGYSGHGTQLFVFKKTPGTVWVPQTDANINTANEQAIDWVKIGQTRDFTGPNFDINDVDVTNNDSPNHFKEYIPGLIEPGDLSFSIIFNPSDATHVAQAATDTEALMAMLLAREVRHFRLQLPIGTSGRYESVADPLPDWDTANDTFYSFDGYIKGLGNEAQMEDAVMMDVTLKVTGNVRLD